MSRLQKLSTAIALAFLLASAALGQDKDPEAYLRVNSLVNQQTKKVLEPADPDRYYFIEIYLPVPLRQDAYDNMKSLKGKIGALAEGNNELPFRMEVSPNDCPEGVCARTHFRMYLPRSLDTKKAYQVFFDSYPVNSDKTLRYRAIDVRSDYSTGLVNNDPGCIGMLVLKTTFDNEDGPFPDPSKIPLKFSTEADKESYRQYLKMRLTAVYDWLSDLSQTELDKITYRVRPLKTLIRPPAELHAVEEQPGLFILPNHTIWQPTETDLPQLRVTRFEPVQHSVALAVSTKFVAACFQTAKGLPTEDFNVKIALAAINPPTEVSVPLIKTGVSGMAFAATPGKPDEKEPGKRLVERDLDIAASFISSVEDVNAKRQRTTRATFDMRVAPFGIRSSSRILSTPGSTETPNATRTSALYFLKTPFFIDAKVSTGKIVKDTLSLNRIILGTQGEVQYLYNNETYPTYFRFIGRFSNVSDRDFKQAEYKAGFEFRPIFSFLNHPLASILAEQNQVIIDKGNKDAPMTLIPFFKGGYEFIPVFGVELGRTYLRNNPAAAIKASPTVKRIYVGADIILTPVNRFTLTLSDTVYFKFDSTTKRRAHYFLGSVDFLIGKFFDSNKASQSLFFSFERGQQPPFSGPGVNAFKFGYRIQADRIFSPIGPR